MNVINTVRAELIEDRAKPFVCFTRILLEDLKAGRKPGADTVELVTLWAGHLERALNMPKG